MNFLTMPHKVAGVGIISNLFADSIVVVSLLAAYFPAASIGPAFILTPRRLVRQVKKFFRFDGPAFILTPAGSPGR
jgi:hypothetical protein